MSQMEMEGTFFLAKELEVEILLGLPVKCLIRFQCVSRNWQSLIGSAWFSTRYSILSEGRHNGKLLCFRKDPATQTHIISLIDSQTTNKIMDLKWPPFLDEGVENKEVFHRGIHVLGPVNGIYCIFNRLIERWIGTLVMWNPGTGEYKYIFPFAVFPFPSKLLDNRWNETWDYEQKRPANFNIGFGFDQNTNDFKVVIICGWGRVHGGDDDRWHVRVYNLYADSWRTIYHLGSYTDVVVPFPGLFPPFPNIHSEPQFAHCLLNGLFHWASEWKEDVLGFCEGILAFDMNDESFSLIHGPPLPEISGHEFWCRSVWVLKETLAMITSTAQYGTGNPTGNVQVWLMNEYGVEESWAMLSCFGPTAVLIPIGIPIDEEIFFRDNEKEQLISSNFEDDRFTEYGIYGMRELVFHPNIHESLGVLRYVETLVPLNTVCPQNKG